MDWLDIGVVRYLMLGLQIAFQLTFAYILFELRKVTKHRKGFHWGIVAALLMTLRRVTGLSLNLQLGLVGQDIDQIVLPFLISLCWLLFALALMRHAYEQGLYRRW